MCCVLIIFMTGFYTNENIFCFNLEGSHIKLGQGELNPLLLLMEWKVL